MKTYKSRTIQLSKSCATLYHIIKNDLINHNVDWVRFCLFGVMAKIIAEREFSICKNHHGLDEDTEFAFQTLKRDHRFGETKNGNDLPVITGLAPNSSQPASIKFLEVFLNLQSYHESLNNGDQELFAGQKETLVVIQGEIEKYSHVLDISILNETGHSYGKFDVVVINVMFTDNGDEDTEVILAPSFSTNYQEYL